MQPVGDELPYINRKLVSVCTYCVYWSIASLSLIGQGDAPRWISFNRLYWKIERLLLWCFTSLINPYLILVPMCKVVPVINKAPWEFGDITPRILNFGTRWTWIFSFTPRSFTPGERAFGTHSIGDWVPPFPVQTQRWGARFLPPPGIVPRSSGFVACSHSYWDKMARHLRKY
jgi:hypothetical protein